EVGDLRRARTLLDRQRPQDGQEDLRDFSWRLLWRLCQGDEVATFPIRAPPVFVLAQGFASHTVALSSDGKALAGSKGGRIRLWDVAARRQLAELHMGSAVRSLAFAPGGQTLAAGCADGTVQLWDMAARKLRETLETGGPV